MVITLRTRRSSHPAFKRCSGSLDSGHFFYEHFLRPSLFRVLPSYSVAMCTSGLAQAEEDRVPTCSTIVTVSIDCPYKRETRVRTRTNIIS